MITRFYNFEFFVLYSRIQRMYQLFVLIHETRTFHLDNIGDILV